MSDDTGFWNTISSATSKAASNVIEQIPKWVASSVESSNKQTTPSQDTYKKGNMPTLQGGMTKQNSFALYGVIALVTFIVIFIFAGKK